MPLSRLDPRREQVALLYRMGLLAAAGSEGSHHRDGGASASGRSRSRGAASPAGGAAAAPAEGPWPCTGPSSVARRARAGASADRRGEQLAIVDPVACAQAPAAPEMSPEALWRRTQVSSGGRPLLLVDVRPEAERAVSVIARGAIPRESFERHREDYRGHTIVFYCTVGYRGAFHAAVARRDGFNAYTLKEALLGWIVRGLPLVDPLTSLPTRRVHIGSAKYRSFVPAGYEAIWDTPPGAPLPSCSINASAAGTGLQLPDGLWRAAMAATGVLEAAFAAAAVALAIAVAASAAGGAGSPRGGACRGRRGP